MSVFVFKYLLSMVEASSRKGSGTWLEFGQRENLCQNQGLREDCTWLATGANKSLQIWFLRLNILKVGRVSEVSRKVGENQHLGSNVEGTNTRSQLCKTFLLLIPVYSPHLPLNKT